MHIGTIRQNARGDFGQLDLEVFARLRVVAVNKAPQRESNGSSVGNVGIHNALHSERGGTWMVGDREQSLEERGGVGEIA